MAINTRSPYFLIIEDGDLSYATVEVKIWTGDSATVPTLATYNLKKFVVAGSFTIGFELAELIKDYIDITFSGNYTSQVVWTRTSLIAYDVNGSILDSDINIDIASVGYSYFQEASFNLDDNPILISNREVFVLADNLFRIPIYTHSSPTVTFFKDNVQLSSTTLLTSALTTEKFKYVSVNGASVEYDTYSERVVEDGGSFESSNCLKIFFNSFEIGEVDKVQVSSSLGVDIIKIKTIEECKQTPKKITFINKFGALQDMYFFKKSVEKMKVSKESYKGNTLDTNFQYSTSNHVNREFNVNASESISLSSGYLSEEYNEVFKQLMLSEQVWLTNVDKGVEQVLAINVKTSDITYKTSLNDRLVEYTIEFDNSFNVINNIR